MSRLTEKEYWDQDRHQFQPYKVTKSLYSKYFEKYIPKNFINGTCLEVGAYPGGFLTEIALRFKLKPVAIEYSDQVLNIELMLKHNGITDYDIINEDFFKTKQTSHDVVASFGFVEHFTDYEDVIKKQIEFVKAGGYFICAVPCLSLYQRLLRKLFLSPKEISVIYEKHNLNVMNLKPLKKAITRQNLKPLYAGYIAGAHNWVNCPKEGPMRKFIWKCLKKIDPILMRLPGSALYSPLVLVIGKKNEN